MAVKPLNISVGWKVVGEGLPIDDRFVVTKAQMLETLDPDSDLSFWMPDPYFAICSDDGKFYTYSRSYSPSEEIGYFKELKSGGGGGGSGAQVWQGTKQADETDAEAIARIIGSDIPVTGDLLVLKSLIADDKYSYTAFVFMDDRWQAMDGNYDADNVYFRNNFVAAGSYDRVGNILKGETVEAKGKSVADIFTQIFTTELNPTITQPSISCSLPSSGTYEVGTKVTPSYSTTFSAGLYEFGPTPTGVSVDAYTITDTNHNTSTKATGTFTEFTVEENTNYTVNASVHYTNGAIPFTNLGNKYPAGQIKEGQKSNTSSAIKGYRAYFYGSELEKPEIDSSVIRNLEKSTKAISKGLVFTMNILEGATRVIIAFPKSAGRTLLKVEDIKASSADIRGAFEQIEVSVEGYDGYTAVPYDVFVYAPKTTLLENTYRVTIG